ncbi:hypothetical protein U3516DRAFT_918678 [Neocallimastix sp. 'constans']
MLSLLIILLPSVLLTAYCSGFITFPLKSTMSNPASTTMPIPGFIMYFSLLIDTLLAVLWFL